MGIDRLLKGDKENSSGDKIEIFWNLRELLDQKPIRTVKVFQRLLREHGVSLAYSQVYMLMNEQPLRVTMKNILAICEILGCSVGQLIVIRKVSKEKKHKPGEPSKKNDDIDKLFKDVKPSKDIEIISGMLNGYNYADF